MSKKRNRSANADGGLWVAERYSLKGPAGERAWDHRKGGLPNSSRFLELADIALGLRKANYKRRKNHALLHDISAKSEPYQS